jgi:hypothetical protein
MSRLRNVDKKLTEQLIDIDDQTEVIEEFRSYNDGNLKTYSRYLSWLLYIELIMFTVSLTSLKQITKILSVLLSLFQLKYNMYRDYVIITNLLLCVQLAYFTVVTDMQFSVPIINFIAINCFQHWHMLLDKDVRQLDTLKYKYKSAYSGTIY